MKVAVRRVNEWDGPSMLKIYAPYTGTECAPEQELPELQSYIQRIDRYTYGLGWLLCEIDSTPVGFCHLTEDRNAPDDLFSVEFQLYVKPDYLRRGVGTALWTLLRDMMELGSRRKVTAYVHAENKRALNFFQKIGFTLKETKGSEAMLQYTLTPADPEAERPTKPYLIDNQDYERAREAAALLVR